MTPRLTSLSSPAFTSSCQCMGTGIGLCIATGVASGLTIKARGGPVMSGSWLCGRVLNVLAA